MSFGVLAFTGINAAAFGSTLAGLALLITVIPATLAANAAPVSLPPSTPEKTMNTTPDFPALVEPFKFPTTPYEYKVTPLRECPLPDVLKDCDTPEKVADYWKLHIATNPYFDPERECLAVLLLNTRRRVKGHQLVSTGTLDTLLISPTSVFRLAIMASAAAIVLCHNHPSGDSSPSSADIKATRDLIRASQLLKIELVDHVVIGARNFSSLRALGHFL